MGWEYQRLAAALENCRDVPVQVRAPPASRGCSQPRRCPSTGMRHRKSPTSLTTNDGTRLAINALAFSNTMSWQFRYEPVLG